MRCWGKCSSAFSMQSMLFTPPVHSLGNLIAPCLHQQSDMPSRTEVAFSKSNDPNFSQRCECPLMCNHRSSRWTWFRAEFSSYSRFSGYPRRLGRHSRAVLCLPCFGRFRCCLGLGFYMWLRGRWRSVRRGTSVLGERLSQ